MGYYVGIDVGSTTSKAVVIDEKGEIVSSSIVRNSHNLTESGRKAFLSALGKEEIITQNQVKYVVSTGYGRRIIDFHNEAEPEVICHGVGTMKIVPTCRTIIDIGGQDSKVIGLDEKGIKKFQMNDKCAAGTGRYLDKLANDILGIKVEQLGEYSLKSRKPLSISSQCTVFAETEIISFLSNRELIEDIIAGMHNSLAKRVIQMGRAANIKFETDIVFSGGVAKNVGIVKAIEMLLGEEVIVPQEPQLTAALGAALMAKDRFKGGVL